LEFKPPSALENYFGMVELNTPFSQADLNSSALLLPDFGFYKGVIISL